MDNTKSNDTGILRWMVHMDNTRMVEIKILQCLVQIDPPAGRISAYKLLNDTFKDRQRRKGIILVFFMCFT
jgi:hypothetical protein